MKSCIGSCIDAMTISGWVTMAVTSIIGSVLMESGRGKFRNVVSLEYKIKLLLSE